MIALVDYGLGNIQAFVNIYRQLNVSVIVAKTSEKLATADKIILPGVGAFDWAMQKLEESGMRACLDDLVLYKKRPVLGVCVGMQIMACRSDEGELSGLNWIDAEIKRFDESGFSQQTRLPHMGWNDVSPSNMETLFKGMSDPRFYFLHSYYFSPTTANVTLATTNYNGPFTSAVCSENVYGTQFHPEKSHAWGIQLLKNFSEL